MRRRFAATKGGDALKRFFSDRSGNYGVLMAVATLPLLLAVGLAVDYSRWVSAHRHLQEMADAASLALAASTEKNEDKLRILADDMVHASHSQGRVDQVAIASLTVNDDQVDLRLRGNVHPYFMSLANITTLDVGASALAVRAVTGSVEMALVLDNTWSMSEKDGKGVSKIDTLKLAAGSLVEELLADKGAKVRIGLVPYADYVNVGTTNRNASWLDVPSDYDIARIEPTCEMKMVTESTCLQYAPKTTCTRYVDGVAETYSCGGACISPGPDKLVEKKVCTGGRSAAHYRWYGCVGSRKVGGSRLDDGSPSVRYPGYVETSQRCLNPIVPLTEDKATLTKAIDGMIINIGGYKPYTYIPAGLIWGQNLLSPTEPFTQATAYDKNNAAPRKVAVLMTDGDNTLKFRASDGRHVGLSSNVTQAAKQVAETNEDTAAICAYMKSRTIEIFTVAFMVDNADAKALLEGCASDKEHYFDASDSQKLVDAFSGIARSLRQVRLAR